LFNSTYFDNLIFTINYCNDTDAVLNFIELKLKTHFLGIQQKPQSTRISQTIS